MASYADRLKQAYYYLYHTFTSRIFFIGAVIQLTTEFHIYESLDCPEAIVVATPNNNYNNNNSLLRCWTVINEVEAITKTLKELLTYPNLGWTSSSANLGPLITIYAIQSHPEYFL